MAIEIRQTPRGLLNSPYVLRRNWYRYVTSPLFAQDENIFVVYESVRGAYKFAYTCVVEWWNGTAYDVVATMRVNENNANCGVFEMRTILASKGVGFQQQARLQLTTAASDCLSEGYVRFTFGSEEAADAGSPPVANASTVQYEKVVVPGTSQPLDRVQDPNFMTTPIRFRSLASNTYPLTSYTLSNYVSGFSEFEAVRIRVGDNDWGFLDFSRDTDTFTTPTSKATGFEIQVYEGSTLLNRQAALFSAYSISTEMVRLFCFPGMMAGPSYDMPFVRLNTMPGTGNENWTHYTVQLNDGTATWVGGGMRSTICTFVRDTRFCESSTDNTYIRFGWMNEFGGFDFINCTGKWRYKQDVKRREYRQVLGNWNTANGRGPADPASPTDYPPDYGDTWHYTYDERGLVSIPENVDLTIEISTGILDEFESYAFLSMMRSRAVFANDVENVQPQMFPVVIRTNKTNWLTHRNADGTIEYTFEFAYARRQPQVIMGSTVSGVAS